MQKTKSTLLLVLSFILIFLMLVFYAQTSSQARSALESALFSVIPVLLPYCFIASIIGDQFYALPKSVALIGVFIIGNICGNPVGAILTQRLYENGEIDKNSASILLAASSATSPAFCICVIGSILSSAKLGLFIYIANTVSNIILFLLFFRNRKRASLFQAKQEIVKKYSFTEMFTRAIKKSAYNMSALAVCMVFFTALSSLITALFRGNKVFSAVISSFLEIGTAISKCAYLPKELSLPISAFTSSFFGLSVFFQVFSNAKELSKATFIFIRLTISIIVFLIFLHISRYIY